MTPSDDPVQWVTLNWRSRQVAVEYQWLNLQASHPAAPLVVFLHEGLGSLALWKDFPKALCEACGLPGLVYSRPGYGQSSPREPHERWQNDFMHQQAREVLPALLDALHVSQPLVLFGHSDGASIALIFAASNTHGVTATVVAAPHLFVEDIARERIAQARQAYLEGELKHRLMPYHQDPESAFWGWNDVWLSDDFKRWNIEAEVGQIQTPLLALQGHQDAYGTMAQIHRIAQLAPQTQLLEIDQCGHSPHRDQCEQVIKNVVHFLNPIEET